MEKVYSPAEIEQRVYQRWDRAGYFAPSAAGTPYCIVIPPPNVTGTLHMGHAFQDTLMDALTRRHRMQGESALWQPGIDHAGIATQMVVERQLNSQGQRRTDFSREQFLERVWAWKEQSGGTIAAQMRRLGASVDWSRERFTMDDGLSRAVREAFVSLYEQGLIYRGQRLVNWDPQLRTALSDLEVLASEEEGSLWYLRYPLADTDAAATGVAPPEADADAGDGTAVEPVTSNFVVVATTRPETMLGDVAVAVHPADERYRALIGGELDLPLTGRRIPIIADELVDPAFGSGCVKITPGHDFNDYAVGARHGLPLINIFTPDARLNDNAPAPFRGLDRFEARTRVVEALQEAGLVERIEPHKLMTPRGDRSGAVIEPYLTDQWYVRIAPLAAPAIEAVEQGRVRFIPSNWDKTYFQWMRNIQDWCISRQLWWGHRIPAWYDIDGNCFVARSEEEARRQAQERHAREVLLYQDDDVLDTWFSSALWPFSSLGWPETTAELERFYPTNVLVTGFDIIFFWVARMVMMGLHFMREVPFREVHITGLVLDAEGQKMSKSKGNVIDPLDIIDGIDLESLVAKRTSGLMQPHLAQRVERATRKQYPEGIAAFGTDALRFTFASLATQGRELRFDLNRVGGYRNFCNKLWNAARFLWLALDGGGALGGNGPLDATAGNSAGPRDAAVVPTASAATQGAMTLTVADRWIRSRLGSTISTVDQAFLDYRFDFAAAALYEFTWYEFCDWYLEIIKPALHRPDSVRTPAARATALTVLETLLRTLHPIMPFITEEIWQRLSPLAGVSGQSIMTARWPHAADFPRDPDAEAELQWVQQIVLGVRQIRGEMDINPARSLPLLMQFAGPEDLRLLERQRLLLMHLAGLQEVRVLASGETAPPSAIALAGQLTLLVPMEGLIDPAIELQRLDKRLQKIEQELSRAQGKLANEQFVSNAPPEVVAQERGRLDEFSSTRARLQRQREQVRALLDKTDKRT
jgi:valyl-tRNA synthetase